MNEDGNGGQRARCRRWHPLERDITIPVCKSYESGSVKSPKPQVKTSCKSTAPTVSPPDDNRETLKKILSTNEKLLSKMEQTYLLLMYRSDPRRTIDITMP
ncbi:uncharacterized protein G2W53_037404 [Senna tora]|uniref:Uncharacterized protein n=1 Tax=Senna tora TaxID=362788 RepID=A0A834SX98_9FABA|nr:uncharacterized protein G2W53_037404 [Senna tora]